jgi:hypothetical protein
MRNKIIYFTGLAILSAVYAAQPAAAPATPSTLNFPTYGFRINSFEMATDTNVLGALVMSLPALPLSGNRAFPPSVNVMIVSTQKEMADYITTERLNMTTNGFAIVKNGDDTSKANEWKVEYIAVASGVAMHWYAHAVWTKGRVYIATGGTPDEMWGEMGEKIKACVNSLQATGTAVIAPLPAISMTSGAAPVPATTPAK